MSIRKELNIKGFCFDSYFSFPDTITMTTHKSAYELDIYKEDAIELIRLFATHFDLKFSDILPLKQESESIYDCLVAHVPKEKEVTIGIIKNINTTLNKAIQELEKDNIGLKNITMINILKNLLLL